MRAVSIQLQLSQKRHISAHFCIPFLESTLNFKNFLKNDDCHSQCISKLQIVKILPRPLSKKRRFRTRFDSQHVKASQILAKSP